MRRFFRHVFSFFWWWRRYVHHQWDTVYKLLREFSNLVVDTVRAEKRLAAHAEQQKVDNHQQHRDDEEEEEDDGQDLCNKYIGDAHYAKRQVPEVRGCSSTCVEGGIY